MHGTAYRTRKGIGFHHAAAAAVLGTLALAGCGSTEQAAAPDCPPVLILADAERFTQYRPGAGRDITDIEAEGEITGFKGACQLTKTGMEVTLAVSFAVQAGPADSDGVATFSYFVAVPAYYPEPQAKAVLPVKVGFPQGTTRVSFVDEEVTLTLPDRGAAAPEIYIGFQLDDEQLRRNRQNAP